MLTEELCPNCDAKMRLVENSKFVCEVCGFFFYDDDLAEEYYKKLKEEY